MPCQDAKTFRNAYCYETCVCSWECFYPHTDYRTGTKSQTFGGFDHPPTSRFPLISNTTGAMPSSEPLTYLSVSSEFLSVVDRCRTMDSRLTNMLQITPIHAGGRIQGCERTLHYALESALRHSTSASTRPS